jgi:hypothetical protein
MVADRESLARRESSRFPPRSFSSLHHENALISRLSAEKSAHFTAVSACFTAVID